MNRFKLATEIRKIRPGGCLYVAGSNVEPADVLSLIVGGELEYSHEVGDAGGVMFRRFDRPVTVEGLRTYVIPERAHLYTRREDGLYEPIPAAPLPDPFGANDRPWTNGNGPDPNAVRLRAPDMLGRDNPPN